MKEKFKKFLKIIGIGFVGILLYGIFIADDVDTSDKSSSTVSVSNTEDSKTSEEQVKSKPESAESNTSESTNNEETKTASSVDDSLRYIGDEMELFSAESGKKLFTATIDNVYIIYDESIRKDVLAMNLDVKNESDETETFYNDAFSLYIDDYQIQNDTGMVALRDSFDSVIDINPGRMAKFLYCTVLPDGYESADNIELECAGGAYKIVIVKDGEWMLGSETATNAANLDSNVYIDYQMDEVSDIVLVRIITDRNTGENTVNLMYYDEVEYTGKVLPAGNRSYQVESDDGWSGTIRFVAANQLEFSSEDAGVSEYNGHYTNYAY